MTGKRVLLVATTPENVRELRSGLEQTDCIVAFAASVRQARKLLETEDFDLLITEPLLSDGSGTALLHDAHALGIKNFLLRKAERAVFSCHTDEACGRSPIGNWFRQAQKLEAPFQPTSTIAHDLNNILMIVIGNLTLLRDRCEDVTVRERAVQALEAAARGERLVRSLLDVPGRQSLELSAFSLVETIREIDPLLRAALGPRRTLVLRLADDVWPVLADATQTEMAILNLVMNTRDAMPDGGRVEIAAANVTLDGEFGGLVGDFVAVAVADTGDEMTPAVLERAFEPFFTTKPTGKGNGIGLTAVRGFARPSRGVLNDSCG